MPIELIRVKVIVIEGNCRDSDDSPLEGFHHRFSTISRVELLIDVRDMVAKCARTDLELVRHFFRGFTTGQQTKNLSLL